MSSNRKTNKSRGKQKTKEILRKEEDNIKTEIDEKSEKKKCIESETVTRVKILNKTRK